MDHRSESCADRTQLNDLIGFVAALVAIMVIQLDSGNPTHSTDMVARFLNAVRRPMLFPLDGRGHSCLAPSSMACSCLRLVSVSSCKPSNDSYRCRVTTFTPSRSLQRGLTSSSEVENPKLVLIIGCIGLTLNLLSAVVIHGRRAPCCQRCNLRY